MSVPRWIASCCRVHRPDASLTPCSSIQSMELLRPQAALTPASPTDEQADLVTNMLQMINAGRDLVEDPMSQSAPTSLRACSSCRATVSSNDKFCANCGSDVSPAGHRRPQRSHWEQVGYDAGRNPSILLAWLGTPVFVAGLGMLAVMAMESFIERHGYSLTQALIVCGIGFALIVLGRLGQLANGR